MTVDFGVTVEAVSLCAAGSREKYSGKAIPPGRAKISGRKFFIASDCCRLWGR